MDGMEVMGNQPHAAIASPYLLSSPPVGHQHQHHHATFNLQAVQLSFDACLTYNNATSYGLNSGNCVSNVNSTSECIPLSSSCSQGSRVCTDISTTDIMSTNNQKTISSLTLTALPIHQHSSSREIFELNDEQKTENFQIDQNIENKQTVQENFSHINKNQEMNEKINKNVEHQNSKYQGSIEISEDKDKNGDLNTPVTTSSDLPSFFGPAVLVEPPPISGNK